MTDHFPLMESAKSLISQVLLLVHRTWLTPRYVPPVMLENYIVVFLLSFVEKNFSATSVF